jgi:hypothetical protein
MLRGLVPRRKPQRKVIYHAVRSSYLHFLPKVGPIHSTVCSRLPSWSRAGVTASESHLPINEKLHQRMTPYLLSKTLTLILVILQRLPFCSAYHVLQVNAAVTPTRCARQGLCLANLQVATRMTQATSFPTHKYETFVEHGFAFKMQSSLPTYLQP